MNHLFIIRWFMCFLIIIHEIRASTHWIVTEDGRIQAQVDSVFSLKRPYDLVALMEQEKRALQIEELKQQLMLQKEEIDRREDKETNLEGKIFSTDEDCITAGKPLTEFDLYITTVVRFPPVMQGSLRAHFLERMKQLSQSDAELMEPYCLDKVDLDFSMHAFEHLQGVRDRHNLTMVPEEYLDEHITSTLCENIRQYGHIVNEYLLKNSTSWVYYNMAAYYWRIQGNATNAIECVRRALHYSPREYKDIALISLGNILHHSHLSEEASIVVHAAVDMDPQNPLSHLTLGNIYAVLADYNKSLVCYGNSMRLDQLQDAVLRYHAVVCHTKLEKALEAQHVSLQRTLTELRDYQKQHEYWLRQHEKLLNEQAPPEVKLEQRLEYEEQKIRESLDGRGQDCFQFEQNGHMVLSCNMRREAYRAASARPPLDLGLDVQLVRAVESRAGRLGRRVAAVRDRCGKTPIIHDLLVSTGAQRKQEEPRIL